ncbi:DNA /pantothenate metabolism flavoprotein [Besnoitia besnoiti]|uniref:DNA /pantothenate metabolism flavoprotein n=1 Tax=Besnoitia besnoiti TaxID=94643 RepID=A0A2A9MCQ9_BESBE|nr:DNA /pantothenate metabolism flavoprotein [Besnoitia besnoiti]PFH36278.1 DNA /pantothenate metabolism flavoprotein [Besnoitia besnoiti]
MMAAAIAYCDSQGIADFFAAEPAPANLPAVREAVSHLLSDPRLRALPLAIVTSGGTNVPIEKNTIRFISNFSTGRRGAALCEQFLLSGFFVIFISSPSSAQPFVRHVLPSRPNPALLDSVHFCRARQDSSSGEARVAVGGERSGISEGSANECGGEKQATRRKSVDGENRGTETGSPQRKRRREESSSAAPPSDRLTHSGSSADSHRCSIMCPAFDQQAEAAVEAYRQCRDRLLCLSFETVTDYLFLLRDVLELSSPLGDRLVVCACAAVSDFYIPFRRMATHKLESRLPGCTSGTSASTGINAGPAGACTKENELAEALEPKLSGRSEDAASLAQPHETDAPQVSNQQVLQTDCPASPNEKEDDAGCTQPKSGHLPSANGLDERFESATNGNLDCGAAVDVSRDATRESLSREKDAASAGVCEPDLTLDLLKVPKMLGMVKTLQPKCFFISFKLETDADSLGSKARRSLSRYSCNMVVGNLLHSRHQTVSVYTSPDESALPLRIVVLDKDPQGNFLPDTTLGAGSIEAQLVLLVDKLRKGTGEKESTLHREI